MWLVVGELIRYEFGKIRVKMENKFSFKNGFIARDGNNMLCPFQQVQMHCGEWCPLFDITIDEKNNAHVYLYCSGGQQKYYTFTMEGKDGK
jgi:hypothetical protein